MCDLILLAILKMLLTKLDYKQRRYSAGNADFLANICDFISNESQVLSKILGKWL